MSQEDKYKLYEKIGLLGIIIIAISTITNILCLLYKLR
jgi:hypothetical protein